MTDDPIRALERENAELRDAVEELREGLERVIAGKHEPGCDESVGYWDYCECLPNIAPSPPDRRGTGMSDQPTQEEQDEIAAFYRTILLVDAVPETSKIQTPVQEGKQ